MDEENEIVMMGERWKKIRGYEDLYLISESGKVYSIRSKKIMKPGRHYGSKNTPPYFMINLANKGKVEHFQVHRLVLTHFVSEPPFEGAITRHLDNNPSNNHYTNLAWGSQKENIIDRLRNPEDRRILLSEQDVIDIKNALLSGEREFKIAKRFNTRITNVKNIADNQSWSEIGPDMSGFNYKEKQESLKPDPKPIIEDYLSSNAKTVAEKYNLTEGQVRKILEDNDIRKTKAAEIGKEVLQPLFDDYMNHSIYYVADKYKMTVGKVNYLLEVYGIKKLAPKSAEELKPLFDDYINYDMNYVMKKYNLSENQVRHFLRSHNITKTKPPKTKEELQPIFDDFLEHDAKYVLDKYNMTISQLYWLLRVHNIKKRKIVERTEEEVKNIIDDYMKYEAKVVIQKYNMTEGQLVVLLQKNNVKKRKKLETKEEIQPMIDDYLKNDIHYVVKKYNMTKRHIYHLLDTYGIHKEKKSKSKLNNNSVENINDSQ